MLWSGLLSLSAASPWVRARSNPQGQSGDLVAYLCFILPDEKEYSSYYKITCKSM